MTLKEFTDVIDGSILCYIQNIKGNILDKKYSIFIKDSIYANCEVIHTKIEENNVVIWITEQK